MSWMRPHRDGGATMTVDYIVRLAICGLLAVFAVIHAAGWVGP